jgi:serine/threonine protein kinase
MEELSKKRTHRFADVGLETDEHTVEFDRETLENELPRTTNDAPLPNDPRAQKTEAFQNDYELALPRHYKLLRLLGRGGMAEVFLALDERLNRSVAIKFLNSEFRREPERMRRFLGEARAASALNHPNILIIHDIGENDGVQYIVSEYVQGETLTARIARGKLPIDEAIEIAIQIASALSASHKAGIVHRDVKPDNIMIRRDGTVKVLDFGLAKETGENLYSAAGFEAQTLEGVATSPGLILGTPQYMSPEQARGLRLDARTDVFSLGIILYEMVTGTSPFPGGSMVDVIAAIIRNEPRKLSDSIEAPPVALERTVSMALKKERDARYPTMEAFLTDLRSLRSGGESDPRAPADTRDAERRTTQQNTVGSAPSVRSIPWNLIILLIVAIPLVFLLVQWIRSSTTKTSNSTTAVPMRSVPITNWSSGTGELVAAASFSPDAKMIAFAATKTGATEIWTKPVAGGEPIQVTKSGFYNQYPVWSPSGEQIAFFSSRSGSHGIWRVSFAGGEQTQIVGGVGPTSRPILWTNSGRIIYQDGGELYAADERTGERKQITDFDAKQIKPRTIQIAGDENTIAYSVKNGDQWNVFISGQFDLPGQIVATSKDQIDNIAFHPDGKSVFYSAAADSGYQVFRSGIGYGSPVAVSNGDNDLFVQNVSGDGTKVLYGSVIETSDLWSVNVDDAKQEPAVNDVAAEFWAEYSPDGTSIAYQSVAEPDRPYRGSVKTLTLGSKTPTVISSEGFAPTWSPDGKWVAYFRRSEAGISIWRVRANGADAQKVADGAINPPGYLATPYLKIGSASLSWSKESSQIAYSGKLDGKSGIWVAAADGSSSSAIATNSEPTETACCPSWTPDGRSIVYVSDLPRPDPGKPGRSRLVLTGTSGNSAPRVLFESSDRFRFLGFGADGKSGFVAQRADPKFAATIPEVIDIYEISLETGAKSKVNSLQNAYFHNIHLSRDGRNIAFVTRKDEISAIWFTSVKGGSPKQLLVENDPKILISALAWSPDGRSIVFGKQTRTNLLSMLSN